MNKLNSALKNFGFQNQKVDPRVRLSSEPFPGDSGFSQWCAAMQMVSRLPGGIPIEFRQKLWLTLAERHIQFWKIDWSRIKWTCLSDCSTPDDEKLGVQIDKDLHRTGCSLFSGEETEHNQALLKKVLLAYARWNRPVGYCQGFNMLAAILLEVMQWNEENALKVMVYLIEGVLPEGYFAHHMRGLSVDMAVFRDLLRITFPLLSQHLHRLQLQAQDTAAGTNYEPPLINVFTMQWFLTLFSNCLPKSTVLRVWDLIFLEGNQILLKTALAIWGGLEERVLTVESADEFYSIMGVLTREMLEFGIMEANELVKLKIQIFSCYTTSRGNQGFSLQCPRYIFMPTTEQMICTLQPMPSVELSALREKYACSLRPMSSAGGPSPSFLGGGTSNQVKRGIRLFFGEEDEEMDDIAMATWCWSNALHLHKHRDLSPSGGYHQGNSGTTSLNFPFGSLNNLDPDRVSLDISALKKQYAKLRERQKQAHIILTGAFANHSFSRQPLPMAVNHLLVGKKPLVRKYKAASNQLQFDMKSSKVEPTALRARHQRITSSSGGETLTWADAKRRRDRGEDQWESSSGSSSSTELCDDDVCESLSDHSPECLRKRNAASRSPNPTSEETLAPASNCVTENDKL